MALDSEVSEPSDFNYPEIEAKTLEAFIVKLKESLPGKTDDDISLGYLDEVVQDVCIQDAEGEAQEQMSLEGSEAVYDEAGERAAKVNNHGIGLQGLFVLRAYGGDIEETVKVVLETGKELEL